MELGIAGRTAIVCASSRGLGRGCAMALARNGVNVVINGRNEAVTVATAEEIHKETGVEATPVIADISTREGQQALLDVCPSPDILINNNGGPPFRDFRELSRADLLQGVTMNFATPIELVQAVIDPMIEQGFGRIVNITSVSVKRPVVGLDLSSGARAGLTAFLAGVARSVAQHNVTINHILPGYIDTDMTAVLDDGQREKVMERIPAGRKGKSEEIASAALFLASEGAAYITGHVLSVDGGMGM